MTALRQYLSVWHLPGGRVLLSVGILARLGIGMTPLALLLLVQQSTGSYAAPTRGWEALYVRTVQQADTGADLDFLTGSSGHVVSRESH